MSYRAVPVLALLVAFALPVTVAAADEAPSAAAASGMGGMGGMKHRCMRKGMRCGMHGGAIPLPQLPPGNAKLQLEMQAEIMQKVGEILARYAARIEDK